MTDQPELDLNHASVDYGWFHVMRPRLMKSLIAEIGETAWAVYTIIKAHADHYTGRAYPSQDRVGELIGKTAETVGVAIARLVEAGLITKSRRGRNNEYQLLESAPLKDRASGASIGSADFKYAPAAFANQLADLKRFITDGVPLGRGITLNLNVNLIQQGADGVVNLQNITLTPDLVGREDMREIVRKLKLLNI